MVAPALSGGVWLIYTNDDFEEKRQEFKDKDDGSKQFRIAARIFIGHASTVTVDKEGNINLPETLARYSHNFEFKKYAFRGSLIDHAS